MRWKKPSACQSVPRGTDGTAAGAASRIEVTLRQTQQRQPWLGLEARATRLAIAGFGPGKLPAQAVDLALLIVCPSRRFALDVAHAPFYRPAGLRHRLWP